MRIAHKEKIFSQMSQVTDIEEFLLHEIRIARKASSNCSIEGDHNKACGNAYVAQWLEEFASNLNIKLDDD